MRIVIFSRNKRKGPPTGFTAVVLFFLMFFFVFPAQAERSVDAYVDSGLGDARVLIPLYADDVASSGISRLVYSGLTKLDGDLLVVPDLASSWEIEEGGKIITFYLRDDVKWHDGEPFTARDVAFTYETALDPASASPYIASYCDIERIEVLSDHKIRFYYSKPYAPALSRFGMGILPEHLMGEEPNLRDSAYARRPVGTGPYRFVEWISGQHMILEAFQDYYQGPPGLGIYVYRIIPDQAVQFLELLSGGIDSMALTPHQYFSRARTEKAERRLDRYKYLSHSYTYLGYNMEDPVLSDKRVRQALSYAIDEEEMIDSVLLGLGEKCTGPFLKGTPYYATDARDYDHDIEKARELLKQAGWRPEGPGGRLFKDGRELRMSIATNQGSSVREQIATVVQAQWERLGVRTDIRVVSWAAFLDQFIGKKNFQVVLLGWTIPAEPDPYTVWHSASSGPGGLNFVSYSNPEADDLIEKGRREFDREKRAEIYRDLHRLIAEDCPYTFLFFPYSTMAIDKRIKGIEPKPAGIFHNFIDWYVPHDEVRYGFVGRRE